MISIKGEANGKIEKENGSRASVVGYRDPEHSTLNPKPLTSMVSDSFYNSSIGYLKSISK